jgi:hypothetical protein
MPIIFLLNDFDISSQIQSSLQSWFLEGGAVMRATAFLLALSVIVLSTAAQAGVPGQISYQGMLTDQYGAVVDTTVSMAFSIYADSAGGAPLWSETRPAVVFSVKAISPEAQEYFLRKECGAQEYLKHNLPLHYMNVRDGGS